MQLSEETRIGCLLTAIIDLQGGKRSERDLYECGASVCVKCSDAIRGEDQKVLRVLADERGLWFTLLKPCKCKGAFGFCPIFKPEPEAA